MDTGPGFASPQSAERVPAESAEHSLLAEDVAAGCREVAQVLLTQSGPKSIENLLVLLEGMTESVRGLSQVPGEPSAGAPLGRGGQALVGQPQNPPRRDARGSVRMNSSPVRSSRNVIAPPASLRRDDGYSELSTSLGIQYEGPPGSAQGGYCAVLLDDVMWDAVHVAKPGIAYTRSLTVEYQRPVPLHQSLLVVGRVVDIDGRKIFAEGVITDTDGDTCATATGLWLAPRPS